MKSIKDLKRKHCDRSMDERLIHYLMKRKQSGARNGLDPYERDYYYEYRRYDRYDRFEEEYGASAHEVSSASMDSTSYQEANPDVKKTLFNIL